MSANTGIAGPVAELDVVIIGAGVIGLSTAYELGRAGASAAVFGASHHEAASGAAAGLLAPSIGALPRGVQSMFAASLALYPAFVSGLQELEPALTLIEGLLDVSSEATRAAQYAGQRMTADQISAIEPSIVAPAGGVFHPRDGALDNQILVRALRKAVTSSDKLALIMDDPVISIDLSREQPAIVTRAHRRVVASRIILAAGAWSPTIRGLPRPLPVEPLKGQMLAVASSVLRHPVMGDDIYLVPRAGEIVIGATVERAGFDASVSPDAIERLRQAAIKVCPPLADARVIRSWAGIRPATPDMLPILGPDPDDDRLLYACGHSKNGILLAPVTACSLVAVTTGRPSPVDLTPFRVDRFDQ